MLLLIWKIALTTVQENIKYLEIACFKNSGNLNVLFLRGTISTRLFFEDKRFKSKKRREANNGREITNGIVVEPANFP